VRFAATVKLLPAQKGPVAVAAEHTIGSTVTVAVAWVVQTPLETVTVKVSVAVRAVVAVFWLPGLTKFVGEVQVKVGSTGAKR
jgi:hypothetical protein